VELAYGEERLFAPALGITLDVINAWRYGSPMIRSFADRDTERLFGRSPQHRFPRELQRSMLRKLLLLDASESLADLRSPPGNRLEKLHGRRAGQLSIRINDQWRICFRWHDGDALDVTIIDYH
jgi:proteic killer suppression protein